MSDQLQPVEVSDEAVEAAAKCEWERERLTDPSESRSDYAKPWGEAPDYIRDEWRADARRTLEAAAPFLTANLEQRIEELEGELAEKLREIRRDNAKLATAVRYHEHHERRATAELDAAGIEKFDQEERSDSTDDSAGSEWSIWKRISFLRRDRDSWRRTAEKLEAEKLATLETPKQERDTEARVEEEVERLGGSFDEALKRLEWLLTAANPGQTITAKRCHIDRDGHFFAVTVEPYRTGVQGEKGERAACRCGLPHCPGKVPSTDEVAQDR